jgi:hypothetical protein
MTDKVHGMANCTMPNKANKLMSWALACMGQAIGNVRSAEIRAPNKTDGTKSMATPDL